MIVRSNSVHEFFLPDQFPINQRLHGGSPTALFALMGTLIIENYDDVIELSLSVLVFNGISFNSKYEPSKLRTFAEGNRLKELMFDDDKFIQELACLHGLTPPRHDFMLREAFDVDEDLALDILSQLQNSSHC